MLDKNDVAPKWDSGPWKFNISEEAPPNTVVTVLKARDPDTIGTLTYTLVPNHRAESNGRLESVDIDYGVGLRSTESQFKLNPTTGQLSLGEALDRETKERYLLRVRADDGLQHRDIVLTIQVSATICHQGEGDYVIRRLSFYVYGEDFVVNIFCRISSRFLG